MELSHLTGVVYHARACDIPAWRKLGDRDVGQDDTVKRIV
jgi:hypothetical protein